ncbi:MAG: hypothetical protein QXU32_01855 [Nitrososphaerales archaeon]
MSFSDRLNKAIEKVIKEEENVVVDANKIKDIQKLQRLTDQAHKGIEELINAMKQSEVDKLDGVKDIIEQLQSISDGLKKDGKLRTIIQSAMHMSDTK